MLLSIDSLALAGKRSLDGHLPSGDCRERILQAPPLPLLDGLDALLHR